MPRFRPPGQCPVCGEWVYAGQAACGECGACAKSGWRGEAAGEGLDLPGDDFDYDAFVEREFGGGPRAAGQGRQARIWWWAAVLLLAALGFGLLSALF